MIPHLLEPEAPQLIEQSFETAGTTIELTLV